MVVSWVFALIGNVTTGPWYVDLTALAGGVGAAFWLYRNVAAPIGQAFWAAILAAPKIVTYLERLIDLLEGDVLARLEAGSAHFTEHDEALRLHATRLDGHDADILALQEHTGYQQQHGSEQAG